jgi:hypothetical protein
MFTNTLILIRAARAADESNQISATDTDTDTEKQSCH